MKIPFFGLFVSPGWKNLTTVDKAIHINAEKRRMGTGEGGGKTLKKKILCVIVRTC
jgi:hypothetical protein